jgi:hypothetical protein
MSEKTAAFVERWKADPSVRFFCCAHVTDQGAAILDTIEAGPKCLPSSVVERVEAASRAHCDASRKLQRYSLAVLGPAPACRTIAQHHFALAPEANPDLGFGAATDTEEPTHKGIVRQTMRHSEAYARIMVQSTQEQIAGLLTENQRLREQNERYADKSFEVASSYEKLITESTVRQLEQQTYLRDQQRMDTAFDAFMNGFLPVVLARMTGATPLTRLLKSLKTEQLPAFFGVLDQDQLNLAKQLLSEGAAAEMGEAKLLGLPGLTKAADAAPAANGEQKAGA